MSDSDDADSVIVLDADDMDLSSPTVQQPGTIAVERLIVFFFCLIFFFKFQGIEQYGCASTIP